MRRNRLSKNKRGKKRPPLPGREQNKASLGKRHNDSNSNSISNGSSNNSNNGNSTSSVHDDVQYSRANGSGVAEASLSLLGASSTTSTSTSTSSSQQQLVDDIDVVTQHAIEFSEASNADEYRECEQHELQRIEQQKLEEEQGFVRAFDTVSAEALDVELDMEYRRALEETEARRAAAAAAADAGAAGPSSGNTATLEHECHASLESDLFYECVENEEDYVYEDCTPEELETLQPVHIMSIADVDAMLPSATIGLDTSCEGEFGSVPFGAIIAANATVQHDQSEFQAFPADTSQPKPFQDLPTMFKALDTPKEVQRAINDIKTGRVKGKHDVLTFTNKKIDLLLNPDIDADTLMASNIPLNDSIIEAINKEDEFVDRGNLGDDLSILTAIIAILNYSVLDDMGKGRGRYGHGMVNLLNGCIMFLLMFMVRWIIGENTGKKCKDVTLDSAYCCDIFFMAFDIRRVVFLSITGLRRGFQASLK